MCYDDDDIKISCGNPLILKTLPVPVSSGMFILFTSCSTDLQVTEPHSMDRGTHLDDITAVIAKQQRGRQNESEAIQRGVLLAERRLTENGWMVTHLRTAISLLLYPSFLSFY